MKEGVSKSFYMYPDELMSAFGYYRTSGEVVKMTPLSKNVYVHMLRRNDLFVKKQSGEHYESQETVARAVSSDYKVVGKILRSFVDDGIIKAKKLRPNGQGQWRWFYFDVCDDLNLCALDPGKQENVPSMDSVNVEPSGFEDEVFFCEDFIVNLPDIGYSKEAELDIGNIDTQGWSHV